MTAKDKKTSNHRQGEGLDPRVAAMLRHMEQQGIVPLESRTPVQAREIINAAARELQGTPEAVANIEDFNIAGPAGQIPVRIYTPQGSGPFPILVYFHGGGWVFCNLDTHDNVCRSLAHRAGCVVLSVDYRLAPEHKFPAAVEDAYAATQWAAENFSRINGDSTRLAVGGDSAGGTLAAVVSLMARDRKGPPLMYQLLAYPATDLSSFDTESHRDNGEGYFLTKGLMEWFLKHYVERKEDRQNPYVSPLLAEDLSGLPPALLITAEFDVLRDEGEAYADRLRQAGISVKCTRYNGMIHAGVTWAVVSELARDAVYEAAAALHSAFGSA